MGLTQNDIARETGMRPSNISRIEKGEQNLSLDTIVKYCDAVRCVPEFTLQEEEIPYGEDLEYSLRLFNERLLLPWLEKEEILKLT